MPPADTGTELELKFQVPPSRLAALEKALATKTARTQPLRAVYLDTADGRLAAARLAWRLRREDARWVQTLKGPGDGLVQRLEDEVVRDAADGDPPPPDAGLHLGTAAGAALAPALDGAPVAEVYGTEITRLKRVLHHQGARIELALDRGHVVVGAARAPVAELEFELLGGPVPALLELAARWAARFGLLLDPATKSERARWLAEGLAVRPVVRAEPRVLPADWPLARARAAMVMATLAHALPNAAAITADAHGPDHVHQLRVGLRRLRSVLRALGPDDPTRDAALAALFAALGGARDSDVLAQTLAPARAAAAALGLAAPPPAAAPAASDAALEALAQPSTTTLWLRLLALALEPQAAAPEAQPPWAPALAERLRRWHRRARREAAEWAALDDPARHRLRKRLKRLRYLLEFLAPHLPEKAAAREMAALRVLQEALGRWNDLVVARAALAPLASDTPADTFAAGWLARDAQAAEDACADAARRWRRLGGRALKARVLEARVLEPRRRKPR